METGKCELKDVSSTTPFPKDLFIYCWLIAQSSAQTHLRAFHKFKFRTQVEYNTKHAHYINAKHKIYRRKERKEERGKVAEKINSDPHPTELN